MRIAVSFAALVVSVASVGCSGVVWPSPPSPLAAGPTNNASLLHEPTLTGSAYQLTRFDRTLAEQYNASSGVNAIAGWR